MDHKKEGNKGQLEKAHRMLQSRKIVSVKTHSETGQYSYVRGMIKKVIWYYRKTSSNIFQGRHSYKSQL